MRDWEESRHFGKYIRELRENRGFSLNQVSEGLCTQQMLSFLEKGERNAPKLLQDALLERLGVGAEDYEHYLPYKEYDRWEARQRIQHCITYEERERAAQLLEQYRITYVRRKGEKQSVVERLERQFYLSMLTQIRCLEGADGVELSALFHEAVGLTVLYPWEKPLVERVLSLKELNLILEAEQYREGGGDAAHYREVLGYIERAGLDGAGMAKVYPKAVYFLCRRLAGEEAQREKQGAWQDSGGLEQQLLRYCNRAVECLRDNSRMYYLWELLDMREQLLARMIKRLILAEARKKAEALEPMRRENGEWKRVLESVYADYGVPRETCSYCYLYVEKGVSCTNDVIRIRREMLGMSQEELCEGICELKSLRKLENRLVEPHRDRVEDLFERLGLPRHLTRTELVTEKPQARRLMRKLRECINDRCVKKGEDLLTEIKGLVSVNLRCNEQALARSALNLQEEQGELEAEEYYRKLRLILELTMPYEAFLKEGEKCLTYEEQSCIQNMMQTMKKDREFMTCIERFEEMYRLYEDKELIASVSGMYEFIMKYVGSELGNMGDYDQSDRYNRIIIKECLRYRRSAMIDAGLYSNWWNDMERKRRGIPIERIMNMEKQLTQCLVFSRLVKSKYYELFYQQKLEQESLRIN